MTSYPRTMKSCHNCIRGLKMLLANNKNMRLCLYMKKLVNWSDKTTKTYFFIFEPRSNLHVKFYGWTDRFKIFPIIIMLLVFRAFVENPNFRICWVFLATEIFWNSQLSVVPFDVGAKVVVETNLKQKSLSLNLYYN